MRGEGGGSSLTTAAWPSEEIARTFEAYENRSEQTEMARAVENAAADGKVLLVEAGTGVGKTLAYLIPGIRAARAAKRPLVVATATINLQTQLVTKDLPRLAAGLFPGLEVRLLKGRSNYLCLEELVLARRGDEGTLFHGDRTEILDRLEAWSLAPGGGSRETLGFSVPYWGEVNCETPICDARACPSYEGCFYYAAREGIEKAEVIVTNHHYLLRALEFPDAPDSPARFRPDAIPEPSLVVFDEAHALDASARSVFTHDVGTGTLDYALRRLVGEKSRGLLPLLRKRLPRRDRVMREALRIVDAFRARIDLAREDLETQRARERGAVLPARLRTHRDGPMDGLAASCAADLGRAATELSETLKAIAESVEKFEAEAPEEDRAAWRRLSARVRGSQGTFAGSAAVLRVASGEDPLPATPSVLWLDRFQRKKTGVEYAWTLAPLEVRDRLESLWRGVPAAVLSSATLAVDGRLDPARARMGGPEARADVLRLGSPFDYARVVRHWVVPGLAPTGAGGEAAHADRLAPVLADSILASRGRALVLFTSLRLLSLTARAIRPACEAAGILLLEQGAEGREALLERFRKNQPAALLATDSFRQGVDLPGDLLSLVVLTRLPFAVPSDPLESAREEAFRADGRDYFREVQIPDAVIRFRQGFGRLIRTATDRGVVLTLDDRILSRPYGRIFLASLPEGVSTEPLPSGEVAERVGRALGK